MTLYIVTMLAIGALAGGFITGLAGFGTALFALGWWLVVLPPKDAVTVVIIMSLIGGIQGMIEVRHVINPSRLARYTVPALLGVPFGIAGLAVINVFILKLIIGCLLIMFGLYSILRWHMPRISSSTPWIDVLIGSIGGVLGGLAGLSGAIPTMWVTLHDWNKADRRAILQPFNMLVLGAVLIAFVIQGKVTRDVLFLALLAFPFTLLGARLGLLLYRRVNDEQFLRIIIWLILISGVVLVSREWAYVISQI
ncbi:MAG: sulfite exporter TauE/SafE family protein [Alphaproteobacteria bacterium]|nr:sulfite exporter TauE/SafE family protein [Alphaproteobacteria bacterium]